jgi:hypothetical protein
MAQSWVSPCAIYGGNAAEFSQKFFASPFSIVMPPLHHIDSDDHAAHYHILILQLEVSALKRFLASCGMRKFCGHFGCQGSYSQLS